MKLIFGEKEVDYSCPAKYAYLNWRFDDGLGSNSKNRFEQSVFDNYEMGKAYLSNATLGLFSIIHNDNACSIADTLIFPILFNTWHGLELWLKSGIIALRLLDGNQTHPSLKSHKILELRDEFKNCLIDLNMSETYKIAFADVNNLIDEFDKVDANFDFARYSFDVRGDFQFYNAPATDNKQWQKDNIDKGIDKNFVPNTCVDIEALFKVLCGVIENFKELLYYLTICINEGESVTDEGFAGFRSIDCHFDEEDDDELDPLEKIMSIIYSKIIS